MTPYILYIAIILLHVLTFTLYSFLISYGNDPLHTKEKNLKYIYIYIVLNRIFSNTVFFFGAEKFNKNNCRIIRIRCTCVTI